MNYVANINDAVEVFTKITDPLHSVGDLNKFAEEAAEDNVVLQQLFQLLEDKEVSLGDFSEPATFAPVDKRRRLTNYVEFTSYVKRNKGKALNPETVNFLFRSIDVQEWSMYAEILGNRFSLLPIEEKKEEAAPQPVAKQQVRQAPRKARNRNTRQASK